MDLKRAEVMALMMGIKMGEMKVRSMALQLVSRKVSYSAM